MRNVDGTWLTLGALGLLAGVAAVRQRGSRSLDSLLAQAEAEVKDQGGLVKTATLMGVVAEPTVVDVELLARLPAVTIVGFSASNVREVAEVARSAIASTGFTMPRKRVVVTMKPADQHRTGRATVLPIALGILIADNQLTPTVDALVVGDLSLGGQVRPVRGILAYAELAKASGLALIAPSADLAEYGAFLPSGLDIYPVDTLRDAADALSGARAATQSPKTSKRLRGAKQSELKVPAHLQGAFTTARKALEKRRPVLILGTPSSGKTLLARSLANAKPQASAQTSRQAASASAAAGLGPSQSLPFRAPHHTVSLAGMAGDRTLRPGELAIAHGGLLFLDEVDEFNRTVRQATKSAYDRGEVVINRASGAYRMPARFDLVMAAQIPKKSSMSAAERERFVKRARQIGEDFGAVVIVLGEKS